MASSSCTPMFYFLHPQNVLNPETVLDLLLEKEHRGYWKSGLEVCYGFIILELNIFF